MEATQAMLATTERTLTPLCDGSLSFTPSYSKASYSLPLAFRRRWRRGGMFQFYSRRNVIIDKVKQPVAGGRGASI